MSEGWDLAEFWADFEAEVSTHLTVLEEGILQLEERTGAQDLVHELFRAAHTIKGAARLMGLEKMANTAATLESILRDIRDGRRRADEETVSSLLRYVDELKAALEAARPSSAEESAAPSPEASGPAASAEPPPDVLSATPKDDGEERLPKIVQLRNAQLHRLTEISIVLHMHYMRLDDVHRRLERLLQESALRYKEPTSRNGADAITSLVQELEELERRLHNALEDTAITLHDLEDHILRFRLVPFATLTPVLRRTVRDAAHALGKVVVLEIEGEETLIDRQLVGPLQDVFIHLLRNAVDHGIESPNVRVAAGKPPEGHIRVVAAQEHGKIVIQVEDDGAGVDVEKVKRRAVERGLIRAQEADALAPEHLLQFLFYPGFSTRSQVGMYSGQGVGLDVVAQTVRRLGGDIHMRSVPGRGTQITLTLPVNLALVEALLVQVGRTRVALPHSHVQAILAAEASPIFETDQGTVVEWQEKLLPVMHWDMIFPQYKGTSGHHIIVMVSHHQYLAIRGGTVQESLTLALHPLPQLLTGASDVYGNSILGDGSVVFLLAVDALLARFQEGKRA